MLYVKNWATDVSNVSLFLRRRKTIKALEVFKFKERIIRDYFYKKHVISKVKEIKEKTDNLNFDLRRKGGVNVLLFFFSFLILEYLPYILASFF